MCVNLTRTGKRVDGIRTMYGDTWSDWHGGDGGGSHLIELSPGVVIYGVIGESGSIILGFVLGMFFHQISICLFICK